MDVTHTTAMLVSKVALAMRAGHIRVKSNRQSRPIIAFIFTYRARVQETV